VTWKKKKDSLIHSGHCSVIIYHESCHSLTFLVLGSLLSLLHTLRFVIHDVILNVVLFLLICFLLEQHLGGAFLPSISMFCR
jgi:hypothetical protein